MQNPPSPRQQPSHERKGWMLSQRHSPAIGQPTSGDNMEWGRFCHRSPRISAAGVRLMSLGGRIRRWRCHQGSIRGTPISLLMRVSHCNLERRSAWRQSKSGSATGHQRRGVIDLIDDTTAGRAMCEGVTA